jgi:hypothetical protein
MTGNDIKTFVQDMYDDDISDDMFYNILNMVKDEVENWVMWEYLKAIDDTQTFGPGDTYLTMKTLPAGFKLPLGDVYVGNSLINVFRPIPFEKRNLYLDNSFKYYIDYKNQQFALIGSVGSTQTIYMPYIANSPEIDSGTSWVFPEWCHKLLAIMTLAYVEAGIDTDDIFARMSNEHKLMTMTLKKRMLRWNSLLVANSNDYSTATFVTNDNMTDNIQSNLAQL